MPTFLSKPEIERWQPYPLPYPAPGTSGTPAHALARQRMQRTGQWQPWQMLGRRMAIGCVALEITQRCNLDCSYCYLSESSEALADIPLEEVFRRIDLIHAHYGPGTDVQVTGGDPTLRQRDELLAIVRRIRSKGLRASLFTNGIKASRDLLVALCDAGLEDVAFHVDMTQQRAGYASEAELNRLREDYIARARGLPLSVFFNTTVFPGNVHELPELVRFFIRHHDTVRVVSFQVGADTGRGTDDQRVALGPDAVIDAIRAGAGTRLNFDAASAGHAACNRYAYGLVVNGRMHDFFNDPAFVHQVLQASAAVRIDRADRRSARHTVLRFLGRNPRLAWGVAWRFARLAWQERRDFIAARGRVGKLSFFVHNFMDAQALDAERCDACSFMVMTPEGPLSMCVHNAKRDRYLLVPATVQRENRLLFFDPVSGRMSDTLPSHLGVVLTRKNARGRFKERVAPTPGSLHREAP
jgi:molybdenum cofactor biosynthesis enzyme MoaA